MARLALAHLDSLAALRAVAPEWDDLWRRSDAALPLLRAELVCQWCEEFAASARVCCLAVEHGGQFVAALPLVEYRLAGLIRVGGLPGNDWCPAGDLLLDPACDGAAALALLAAEINRARWPLVHLDGVDLATSRWRAFQTALERAGLATVRKVRCRVGQVKIDRDWDQYAARFSKRHRRYVRRLIERDELEGPAKLQVYRPTGSDEIESLLRRGFEIEHRSWKGRAGSSVLASRNMFQFYLRQACQLAAWGSLELVFLEIHGEPIAFEYGLTSKGVYYSLKVGYDERFKHQTPGQLLRLRLLEQFHADPARRLVDYLGPLSAATAKWSTRAYSVDRLIVAPRRAPSRMLLSAYRCAVRMARLRRLFVGSAGAGAFDQMESLEVERKDKEPAAPLACP